jgi:hypothetical protein
MSVASRAWASVTTRFDNAAQAYIDNTDIDKHQRLLKAMARDAYIKKAVEEKIAREAAQTAEEQPNEGNGEKVPVADIRRLVSDLRVCAESPAHCRECTHMEDGCCYDRLKTDAADMLEKLMGERT